MQPQKETKVYVVVDIESWRTYNDYIPQMRHKVYVNFFFVVFIVIQLNSHRIKYEGLYKVLRLKSST